MKQWLELNMELVWDGGGPSTGACCVDSTCYSLTESDCEDLSGNWLGEGSSCESEPCVPVSTPELPTKFALYPCSPNPFNPSTTIRYSLPVDAEVSLVVYDLLGRKTAVLA